MAKAKQHSDKFELVKKYYDNGTWSEYRVRMAVEKGWITQDELVEIVGENE